MNQEIIGKCLSFAGLCMFIAGGLGIADWTLCISRASNSECRTIKSDAVTVLLGASNMALGIAVQDKRPGP